MAASLSSHTEVSYCTSRFFPSQAHQAIFVHMRCRSYVWPLPRPAGIFLALFPRQFDITLPVNYIMGDAHMEMLVCMLCWLVCMLCCFVLEHSCCHFPFWM